MRKATYKVMEGNRTHIHGVLFIEGKGFLTDAQMDEVLETAKKRAKETGEGNYDDVFVAVEEIEGGIQ